MSGCVCDLQAIHARKTAATHQVYAGDMEVWDATLNQTDLSKNANKCAFLGSLLKPCRLTHVAVTGFTCCNFYIQLAIIFPACSSRVGVVLEKLVRPSARLDVPLQSPKPLLTTIFQGPFPATTAISEFKKQFKSKTATNWDDRQSMTSAKSGKIQRTL